MKRKGMKKTRALTKTEVLRVLANFKGPTKERNRLFFLLAINTGYRVSELLSLRVNDVLNKDGSVVDRLTISNCKRGKPRTVALNSFIQNELSGYIKKIGCGDDALLFPIGRVRMWRIMDTVYQRSGVRGNVGIHGLRKYYGTKIYEHLLERVANGEKVDPMRAASKALGHSDLQSTDTYLAMDQGIIDEAVESIGKELG